MNIRTPKPSVKLDEPISRPEPDQNVSRARHPPSFAQDLAASEFGGRYFGWREWADFTDISPKTLTEKRERVMWREPSS